MTNRFCYNILATFLTVIAAFPSTPTKPRVVTLRKNATFSTQSPENRSSIPVKFPEGNTAYLLSLEPDFDRGHHVITVELTLRHAGDKDDAANLLDPTGKRHGLQAYDFAADDLAEGAQKSVFGKERTVSLRNLGLVIRITILNAVVSPISGTYHQLDTLELQIDVDNSNP
jgi:hypothetical protein